MSGDETTMIDAATAEIYSFVESYLERRNLSLQVGERAGKSWQKLRTPGGVIVAEGSGEAGQPEPELLLKLVLLLEGKIRDGSVWADSDGKVLEP